MYPVSAFSTNTSSTFHRAAAACIQRMLAANPAQSTFPSQNGSSAAAHNRAFLP